MTATSSIPAVIDALVEALRARPALQDPRVHVADGFPTKGLTGIDLITVGGQPEPTAEGEQAPAAIGGTSKNEDYRIRLYCSSVRPKQKAARDAAFALMAEVERLLDSDRKLGGVVSKAALVAGGIDLQQSHGEDPDTMPDGQRWASVAFDIRITNRLS